jgi:hypothetical protein
MKNKILIFIALIFLAGFSSCKQQTGRSGCVQTSIPRIDQMPELPQPLKIIDWKQKALQFDSLAFDFNNTAAMGPYIWLDSSRTKH